MSCLAKFFRRRNKPAITKDMVRAMQALAPKVYIMARCDQCQHTFKKKSE